MKSVLLYKEGVYSAKQISRMYNVSDRTLRRWRAAYEKGEARALMPKKTGPRKVMHAIPRQLEHKIIRLKERYPSWGARRIKHQFGIPVSWRTVHRVLKRHGLLIRIKAKTQICKRFQRIYPDSLWQGDTFQFRIHDVGRVYVTGFIDDCSRYRIVSKAYVRKRQAEAIHALHWALRKGRMPEEIYLDNGKQFVSKSFKRQAAKYRIKLIYGRPHNPRGRGKIENYHKVLWRELISLKEFDSLSHFRRELWKFDRRYNGWRKLAVLGWRTPASIYNDVKYINGSRSNGKKRT